MTFPRVCVCGARALPGKTRCERHQIVVDERARMEQHPERAAYGTREYRRNRVRRYEMAGGRCENCGDPVSRQAFETHHTLPLDYPDTNKIENLRNSCKSCNTKERDARRRAAKKTARTD
jgi:5-methylcytosine-specific restriction endonuclease McrA